MSWEIENSEATLGSKLGNMFTLGAYPELQEFTIRNTETDEVKTVTAYGTEELGERIANGEFDDD